MHQRLADNKRYGYTLALKIKYGNYETITRSRTRDSLLREPGEILQLSLDLLAAHLDLNRPVRLLSTTISNLAHPQSFQQLTLDLSASDRREYE
ncbi:MAG: hypothetical protein WBA76_08250 [Phormidesmis sp.]